MLPQLTKTCVGAAASGSCMGGTADIALRSLGVTSRCQWHPWQPPFPAAAPPPPCAPPQLPCAGGSSRSAATAPKGGQSVALKGCEAGPATSFGVTMFCPIFFCGMPCHVFQILRTAVCCHPAMPCRVIQILRTAVCCPRTTRPQTHPQHCFSG
jgi:hypothetical protein